MSAGCGEKYDAARDEALKNDLGTMRRAIAAYRADRGSYPASLQALVPNYMRKVPDDPITGKPDWKVMTEESVQPSSDFSTAPSAAPTSVVIDVRSNAPGADRAGVPYSNY